MERGVLRTMTGMLQTGADNGLLALVVDDDARSRELLRVVLCHAGFRVLAAPDGQAAVALLATERPRVILADLLMPGMTGLDLCRWARQRPELADVRFVLLTGMDTDETSRQATEAGADAVVVKPFERTALVERLDGLLGRQPAAG